MEKKEIKDTLEFGGKHYHQKQEQPIEYIYKQGWGQGFTRGNAVKYISRAGMKGTEDDAVKDLIKAIHYCMYILEFEYNKKYILTELQETDTSDEIFCQK